jgi:two-component system phosphate regulon sensor histidine kinase PhoR
MGNVAAKLQNKKHIVFMINTIIIKIVLVKRQKRRFIRILLCSKNTKTNKTIVYSNSIISEDYDISSSLFNKKFNNDKFKILILNE